MPISADRFEDIPAGETDKPAPETNAARILEFLREHPGQAFRQSEIADATDVAEGSVGPTLVRLRERGRVDHRANYWRVSDHEESVDVAASHAAAVAAARESEEERPTYDEWQEHAVDPRDDDAGE